MIGCGSKFVGAERNYLQFATKKIPEKNHTETDSSLVLYTMAITSCTISMHPISV